MNKAIQKVLVFIALSIGVGQLIRCSSKPPVVDTLFNGKNLSGWDVYIRSYIDDTTYRDTSVGLNRDPYHVFSVIMDSTPTIRVSGEYFGGISTKQEYSNYHLSLQFKWGKAKIASFKDRKRDSGLLYHAVGPHGADYGAWMRSQEFQIQEGDCGDYWGVAGGIQDVPALKLGEKDYVYDASQPLTTFKDHGEAGRRCKKSINNELQTGSWNTIDLYCYGDTSVHVVNGRVVMVLYHSRQLDNATERPLKQGKIQLQSEGCEVYYRNIRIQRIQRIPQGILH